MTGSKYKQLNPFELKSALTKLLAGIHSVEDLKTHLDDFELLDCQTDKKIISKILFKELYNAPNEKIPVICFMLEHFLPKEELINKFWETLKNKNLKTEVKITILNLLRELDADWSYDSCSEYLDDADSLLDENTKQLLNTAVINPEVQIDFMDFMASIRVQDKITLLNSFNEDFSSDALANILIPVFVSNPDSPEGKEALKLLAGTKSQLALHTLDMMSKVVSGELLQAVKKSLSTIKISGMREDNTGEFYKKILSNSRPHKFYMTYPDGHGDMALIFTRITEDERIRFVSVVINVETGIKDCFGFFDISQFECNKILERFLRDEKTVNMPPESFKTILNNAELTTIYNNQNKWKLPYEYVCWKSLLIDIDCEETSIKDILKNNLTPVKIDENVFEEIERMKVSTHWFLDYQYSSEFETMLKELKSTDDFDTLIKKYVDEIFYEEEKNVWTKKLEISAYMKFAIGKQEEANVIYSLAQDNNLKQKMYRNILRRSIYEYLTLLKYDKSVDSSDLTPDDIDDKIKIIEQKWVANV